MDANAFHADARAYRIDPLVMADDGYLRTIARLTHDAFDLYDAVVNLRHLELEQALHEDGISAADDHLRTRARLTAYFLDHGAQHVSLAIAILIDLLFARQHEFRFVMDDEDLAPAHLIDFADNDFPDYLRVLLEDVLLLDVANALAEGLPCSHYGAAPEVGNAYLAGYFVADVKVFIDAARIGQLDLRHRILEIEVGHDFLNVQDLDVSVIGVEDDLEGIISTVALADHGAKNVLHDHLQHVAFDALLAGDLRERRYENRALHMFSYCVISLSAPYQGSCTRAVSMSL